MQWIAGSQLAGGRLVLRDWLHAGSERNYRYEKLSLRENVQVHRQAKALQKKSLINS
jgi:hypothetical protein